MVFLHLVLFLVIDNLDQVHIIKGIGDVWVRGGRSSNKLLSHLKDFKIVVL